MAIQVIDFSKLNGVERVETLAQIDDGCEEWGFFQLINHGVPVELLDRVKKVCSECYKREREKGFKASSKEFLKKMEACREEDMDWEDVFFLQEDNEWPSNPREFKDTMKAYRVEIKKLAEKLTEVMDENLGLDKGYIKGAFCGGATVQQPFFGTKVSHYPPCPRPDLINGRLWFKDTMKTNREEIKKLAEKLMEVMDENLGLDKGYIKGAFCGGATVQQPFFGTKVSHYPPCPCPDLINGLRAHTDAGGVILLFQDDEVAGLQILKDGQWIDVQPLTNSIVINTGDQIEVLSNGRYKSVWHRVHPTPDGNRRSIASFYNPAMKATIGPAAELVSSVQTIGPAAELVSSVQTTTEVAAPVAFYLNFLFGDYMDVYVKQKVSGKGAEVPSC